MRKGIITVIALAIIACVATIVYCRATDGNKVQEKTADAQGPVRNDGKA